MPPPSSPRPTFLASAVRCEDHAATDECSYRIAWRLNPHMVIGGADPVRAEAQHAALLRAVRAAGADVDVLPFVHGAYDSVFAKDNAVYVRHGDAVHATMASPRHPERQREQSARIAQLRALGYRSACRSGVPFEGGDVIVRADGTILLGHGFRSQHRGAALLRARVGLPVVPLELTDEHLYHLDTALNVLHDGTVLVCEEAFTPPALATLRETARDWVAVPRAEAMAFALNFVEIGATVVTGTDAPVVRAALEARGRHVVVTPLDEFQRAGGSAACLLAPVHDARAWATDARRAG